MKVEFSYKNGRTRRMTSAQADLLQRLGHGTYQTREMRAAVPAIVADELDFLTLEELQGLAKERGIKVHHRAGADKVRKALRSS